MTADDLALHGQWLRKLATDLVGAGGADDLVQQTYVAALTAPPTSGRPVRPWLAKVMRNALSMDRRSRIRRERRESVAVVAAGETSDAEALLARAQSLRSVAEAVESLDEPYRQTLLLRYLEELPAARIAEREGVAASTVRWRAKEGLDMLRVELDRRNGGDRQAWVGALVPALAAGGPPSADATAGAMTVKLSTKTAIAITTVALVGVAGTLAARDHEPAGAGAHRDTAAVPVARQRVATEVVPTKQAAVVARPDAPAAKVRRFASARHRQATLERLRSVQDEVLAGGDAEAEADDERFTELIGEVVQAPEVTAAFLLPALDECLDALPGDAKGSMTLRMHVTGAPDIGSVIANSEMLEDLSSDIPADVVECAVQTGYALEFPPPPVSGSARIDLSLAFDRANDGMFVRLGTATPATPHERVYAEMGPDGEPLLYAVPEADGAPTE